MIGQKHEQVVKINEDYHYYPQYLLGSGAFGQVYKGYSLKKNMIIAVKIVAQQRFSNRQIETLSSLSSLIHPNIMSYYGNYEKDKKIYIFLQYCPEGTLETLIQTGLTQAEVLKLFRQIVQGMCYMNAKKKMHRDFKPQNVLIGHEKDIKICDFGLAQSTHSIFVTGQMGTAIYAAPEVFLRPENGQLTYNYNCDVWSVGLTLFQMLTGKKLFLNVKNYKQLKNQWLSCERGQRRINIQGKYHPLWSYFLNWMIQFDANRRPTFHEVLQKIKKIYNTMLYQLINESGMNKNKQYQIIERYIDFQVQKHDILINLCQQFTKTDISIRNQFKYLIMFLTLAYYSKFTKEFINQLRYKKLKYQKEQLIKNEEDILIEMLVDKHRLSLEQKYYFYQVQLKNNIIKGKILGDYCLRKDPEKDKHTIVVLNKLRNVIKLVERYDKGQFIQSQDFLQELKQCIKQIQKQHQNKITQFSLKELKIFNLLLISALLQNKFPQKMFQQNKVIQNYFQKIDNFDRQTLYKLNRDFLDEIGYQ